MKICAALKSSIVVLIASGLPAVSYANSLNHTVNEACRFHPDVFTAGLQLQEANERYNEAKATVLPRINSVTEAGISDDRDGLVNPLRNSRPFSTQLSLDQPLYIGGRGRAAIKGAKLGRTSERYRSQSQILNVQLRAIQAHLTLAQAQQVLRVRQENLTALQKRRNDAARRFELGGGTRSEIVQAEARISRGEAEIISARQAISSAKATLFEASGILNPGGLSLPSKPTTIAGLDRAIQMAREINPDVLSLETQIAMSEQSIKTAQGDRSPEIRLLGDLNIQRDTVFNDFERDEASLRLRMTIPMFAGGALSARERASKLAKQRASYEYTGVMNRVYENVRIAWSRLAASSDLVRVNQDLVKVAEQAEVSVRKEADAGFRPNLDVLDAQQELLEARLALTEAQYNEVLAAYSLTGSIGRLDNSAYPACQKLLPEFDRPPRYKIIETLDTYIPGISLQIPEKRQRSGPRSRR